MSNKFSEGYTKAQETFLEGLKERREDMVLELLKNKKLSDLHIRLLISRINLLDELVQRHSVRGE